MPIARLSGHVSGKDDPNRKTRARLLYRLFGAGWDIYNSNGDQVVTLGNIQKKIIESDAFVFTPGAHLEDMFQAASIFVGHQTNDRDLLGKPTVIQNTDGSWNAFVSLIEHLHDMGTVKQRSDTFLNIVAKPKDVLDILEKNYVVGQRHDPAQEPDILEVSHESCLGDICIPKPAFNVCVFCSASISKNDYLQEGFDLGVALADEGWGCISGAGKTGIMGKVVAGSVSREGWTGGSNVPHIIALEGLPKGMAEFWPRADIYTRMEVMIENSHAFVIMPGGLGTVQEVFALVLLKQQEHALMKDKPIIIFNRETDGKYRFWDPLIELLENSGTKEHFTVVKDMDDLIPAIRKAAK